MLEHVTGVANEVVEQLVLGRGQVEVLAAETRLLAGEVDLQVTRSERWRAAGGCRHVVPPEHGPHARHELEVVERLRHVVVRAELEALDLVHRVVAGREHHDRDVGEGTQLTQHLESVLAGQPDVQQDQVGRLAFHDVQRHLAGGGSQHVDLAPLEREPETDRLDDVGLVIHDQDLHHGSSSSGPDVGTTRANRLPRPTVLSTSIVPPWAWAIASDVGSPRPTPSRGPERSLRPTKKRSNRRGRSASGMPGPSSSTTHAVSAPRRSTRRRISPDDRRVALRVREEVDERLLEPAPVPEDLLFGRDGGVEHDPLPGAGREGRHDGRGRLGEREGAEPSQLELDAARPETATARGCRRRAAASGPRCARWP